MPNNTPSGYLDRYDRDTKGWKKILFRPGKVIQSSELNELQTILSTEALELGSELFGEGKIIDGCEMFIDQQTDVFTMGVGKFFAFGYVHDLPELNITVTGSGQENIGLKLNPVVITENEDSDLLDLAANTDAFGKAGAHRLVYEYSLVINDNTTSTVAYITDGFLSKVFNNPLGAIIEPVNELIALRTFEESGNYVVEDYDIKLDRLEEESGIVSKEKFLCLLKGGLSYVKGYRHTNGVTVLRIDRSLDTESRVDEPEPYVNLQLIYNLDNDPVRSIDNVTAIVRSPVISMTRGTIVGGNDEIPVSYQPTSTIFNIDDGTTTFVNGTDFVLNGNFIDWSPGGVEPPTGGTYYLTLDYVKQLVKGIRFQTYLTAEVVTRTGGNVDSTLNSNVSSITKVSYNTTEYIEGTDYDVDLKTGTISWLTGTRPAGNYLVDYSHWIVGTEGDYLGRDSFRDSMGTIKFDETPEYLFTDSGSIDYKQEISYDTAGDKPVAGQIVSYDYQYTVPRKDVLCISSSGLIFITKGKSSSSPEKPSIPEGLMEIATLNLPPEATEETAILYVNDIKRTTMEGIRTIVSEINNIRNNQARFELENGAANIPTPTDKIGIIVDNFSSFDKSDLGHLEYEATIDPLSRNCSIGQELEVKPVYFKSGTTVASVDPFVSGSPLLVNDMLMKSYEHSIVAIQPFATDTIQANPYTVVNIGATLAVNPKTDNWTDETVTEIQGPDKVIRADPRVIRNRITTQEINGLENLGALGSFTTTDLDTVSRQNSNSGWGDWWRWWWANNNSTTETSTVRTNERTSEVLVNSTTDIDVLSSSVQTGVINVENQVVDSVEIKEAPFARQISLTLNSTGYIANEDDIVVEFDGRNVPLTPVNTTVAGTQSGSVKADANGDWDATFVVPDLTPSGNHLIRAVSRDPNTVGTISETTFSSNGTINDITRTVTLVSTLQSVTTLTEQETETLSLEVAIENDASITSSTSTTNVWVSERTDPIAQTFEFNESFFLSKLEVFFNSKPLSGTEPVECIIAPAENGIPTSDVLAIKSLVPSEVNEDTSANTATTFVFDSPAYISADKEYAFIIRSNSSEYVVHIATVGENDPSNGLVVRQPFAGVMLSSANMKTWTPHQKSDVKFTIWRSDFANVPEELVVNFDQINLATTKNRVELKQSSVSTSNSSNISWEISSNNTDWKSFPPPMEVFIDETTSFNVRAKLTGNHILTPIIADECSIHCYKWALTGAYIMRQMELPSASSRYVDVYMQEYLPAGTTVVPKVQLDESGTWEDMTYIPGDDRQVDLDWTERHYVWDSGNDSTLIQKVHARVNMTTASIDVSPLIKDLIVMARAI